MRIRARRLSFAAIGACVVFLAVAAADVRSFWTCDEWDFTHSGQTIDLVRGCFLYRHYALGTGPTSFMGPKGHISSDIRRIHIPESIGGFIYDNRVDRTPFGYEKMLFLRMPLWPPLFFLLLIGPVRWLVVRSPRRAAFPILTDPRDSSR